MGSNDRSKGGENIAIRGVGQPSKLTKETKDKIKTALLAGCKIKSACTYAEINERTYYTWKERGEVELAQGKETQYTQFLQFIQECQELARPRLEMILSKAAEQDWKAALTILERRYPEDWSAHLKLGGDEQGQPIQIEFIRVDANGSKQADNSAPDADRDVRRLHPGEQETPSACYTISGNYH
jgi:hypothetical protein